MPSVVVPLGSRSHHAARGPRTSRSSSMTNSNKINCYGIEVIGGVRWEGWEPGQEYTKNITLKNVHVKTQKLKYKVPESRFFTTLYPQPIVLSAGTSFTLPVTFRPLEKNLYEDKIEFLTKEGTFTVPMQALLPRVEIAVPEQINFNMCAAHDSIQLSFDIKNASELVTPFQVECPAPFTIEPQEGVLQPHGSFKLNATFTPKAAVVYETEAVIKYGPDNSNTKSTRLEGIGKFPHLMVPNAGKQSLVNTNPLESVISFDDVCIGDTCEKWIEVRNISPVNAPFHVEHPTGLSRIDTVFQCLQKEGVVPPLSSVKIPIVFSPNTVDATSIDYFKIVAIGNVSKTVVKCVGHSKGPQVHLSHTALNFFQLDAGRSATKTFDIVNDSDMEASYQFMLDCEESVFKLEASSGTLKPHSKETLIMRFEPVHPINYHRSVTCLIHNQLPLFLDLLGTCHTETVKPAVLQVKHLEKYRAHVERGFSFLPPEQLNEMVQEGKLKLDEGGTLINSQDDGGGPSIQPPRLHPMDEFFNDGYHTDVTNSPPHVSIDIHQADFGRCTDMRNVHQMTVNATNHTKGKITVEWMGGPDHVFSVMPASTDIPPLGSAPFTVTFKPTAPNQFFGSELECYCYYKSLRDYRLVEDTTHCPPWCLTLTATGHTFATHCETFLPRYMFNSHKLVFPAVNVNETTYRTVLLTNTGPTPILFDFEKDPQGIFQMKPTKGLVRSGHQMFVVKIQPPAVQTYKQTLLLKLNDAEKNTQEIMVYGSAESAEVVLENEGVMYFKPTCVGTASRREYSVQNVSRIPLMFEWKMKHADGEMLCVTPSTGVIQPNESQLHTWSFTPKEQTKSVMKPTLVVWGQGQSSTTSAGKKREFAVRAIGEGSLGEIKAEQSYLNFGTIVVGSTVSQQITLYNESNCSLYFRLHIEQTFDSAHEEDEMRHLPLALELERMEGVLPARSRQVITGKLRPHCRHYYKFNISYELVTPQDANGNITPQSPRHLCHILGTGVFPSIVATDARCYGSAINISKKQLWSLFSLDNLNVCLDSDPSAAELVYSAATRHSHSRRPPVYTRAILDFNFGAAPINSEPCIIQLMLENTGSVATEWAFLFPHELHMELEYWAETGEFDEDELHEMKVMDNKLFAVEPSRGALMPGECKTITFRYQHIMAGTDRVPVLLKLAQGREILLNFVGVTVEPDRRYIHFPGSKFMFAPVAIGDKDSPKQIYELYNGGALPVKYEFNTTALQILKQENYDHEVFEVLNPMGEILPGHTANIEWKFSPLEAKTYMVDVPIQIHNGDTAIVTFTGVGYDRRALGNTMPVASALEMSGVPGVQSVAVPGQLCYLSQERLAFGSMPLYSRVRRMVTMSNRSNHPISYHWHVTSQHHTQFVSISPSKGTLQPGDAAMCKVTFTARGVPSFYDLDLVCEVLNLTDYSNYLGQVEAWETERERQSVEFTITEKDLEADMRLPEPEIRPPSGRLRALGHTTPAPEEDLAKYKTLPPIKTNSIDRQRSREKSEDEFMEGFWPRPQPPEPFLMHLGVTARTHDIAEFQISFPDQYKAYHIDRTLNQSQPQLALESSGPTQKTACVEAEADVIAGAITNIIRGLLDDTLFVESVEQLMEEDTPYYHQFKTPRELTPPTTAELVASMPSPPASPPVSEPAEPAAGSRPQSASSQKPATPTESRTERLETAEPDAEVERASRASSVSSKASQASATSKKSAASSKASRSSKASKKSGKSPSAPATPATSDADFALKQTLKKSSEFGSMLESILENTLTNIVCEAFHKEFNITARPRLVALLPRPPSAANSQANHKP